MNCAHESCNCKVTSIQKDGQHFCSTTCAQSAESENSDEGQVCNCGHRSCQAA